MYIGLAVQIHSLPEGTLPEDIRKRVYGCLSEEFNTLFNFEYDTDVIVDIEEVSGTYYD